MLDHFGLIAPASSWTETLSFYDAALSPLNYKRKDFIPDMLVGYAADGINFDFWIHKKDEESRPAVHFAFRANRHEQVDQFHANGLKAGGTDNGKPGIREVYHPNYYGAFVKDPCGNSVEVVIHSPRESNSAKEMNQVAGMIEEQRWYSVMTSSAIESTEKNLSLDDDFAR